MKRILILLWPLLATTIFQSGCCTTERGDAAKHAAAVLESIQRDTRNSYTNLTAYRVASLPDGAELPKGTVLQILEGDRLKIESLKCITNLPTAVTNPLGSETNVHLTRVGGNADANWLLGALGLATIDISGSKAMFVRVITPPGRFEIMGETDLINYARSSAVCAKTLRDIKGDYVYMIGGRVFRPMTVVVAESKRDALSVGLVPIAGAGIKGLDGSITVRKTPEPNGSCLFLVTRIELEPLRKLAAANLSAAKKKELSKKVQKKPTKKETSQLLQLIMKGSVGRN